MPDYEQDGENFDAIFNPPLTRDDVRREVTKVLTDINTFGLQAQAGVNAAVQELRAKHPDFEAQRPRMLRTLEQIPLLKQAVASAESNPQLSGALPEMYETIYQASHGPAGSTAAAPIEPSTEGQSASETDFSSEDVQHRAALASQRVDLSPGNRKALIAELEKRGVGDIEF